MNTLSWIVDGSFSTRLTLALLHFLWQGCAGGLVVIVGGWLLRDAAARSRYLLNVATMLLMSACLPVTFLLLDAPDSGTERAVIAQSRESPAFDTKRPEPTKEQALPAGSDVVGSDEPSVAPDVTTPPRPKPVEVASNPVPQATQFPSLSSMLSASTFATLARWVAVLYLTGVTLILGRLLRGVWGGDRLRKMATPIKDAELLQMVRQQAHRLGLKVVPTIAWCEQISIPVVVGIITPMILLPMAVASGLTPSQLQALLLHELSHIHRFDPIVNLLQRIVEAALFFHPLVWFVSRRISIERELAADDMVLAAGWDRPLYADALVRVAELASSISGSDTARRATVLGASGTNPSEFKARVLRLLGEAPPPKLDLTRVGIAVTLLLLVVGGTIAWSQSNKPEQTAAPSKPAEDNAETAKPLEDEIVITGRVTDMRGDPIAKALVVYTLGYDPSTAKPHTLKDETDRNGAFRLAIKKSDIPTGLKLGPMGTVWAWSKGYAIGAACFDGSVDLKAGAQGKPVSIQLPNSSQSVFVVKTETGAPLAGATVIPKLVRVPNGTDPIDGYFGLYDRLPDVLLDNARRVTDATGRVVIDIVPRSRFHELEVHSKSHGTQSMRLTASTAEEILPMRAVSSVSGQLVDGPIEWMRGVRLYLVTSERETEGQAEVVTDQNGSFHIPALATGTLRISAHRDPQQPWRLVFGDQMRIAPGGEIDLTLRVAKGIPVTGRLVIQGGGEPVSQASISVNSGSLANSNTCTTDERGEFQTFVVPGDKADIQVINLSTHPGLTYPPRVHSRFTIPKDVDSFRIPDIEIPKAKAWTGRLIDQSGQPIAGKYVQAFDRATLQESPDRIYNQERLIHPVRTDADGAFKLVLRDDQIPNRWSALIKWDKEPGNAEDSLPAEIDSVDPLVLRVKLPDVTTTFKKPPLLLPDHWIVTAVGFDNDGKELVTASIQSFTTIRRWDLVNNKLISEIMLESDKHGRPLRGETLMLSADRRKVIAATDAYVGIWDTSTGKLLKQLQIPKLNDNDTVRLLTCTPDFSVVVGNLTTNYSRLTLHYDANTVVWDGNSGKMLRILTHKGQNDFIAISLSANGKRLATTNGGGALIWDTGTGQQLLAVTNDNSGRKKSDPEVSNQFTNNVWSIRLSPDGKLLAMGDTLGVKLLDSTSGKLVQQLEGPYRYSSGISPGLVFSKDGRMLARLGTRTKAEYVIPIWSTQTGQKLFELQTDAYDAAFSDDGQRLAVVFSDLQQALSVWQLNRDASDPEQTEGPGPEPRQDKVEQNGHYRGATAAQFIDTFKPTWSDAKLGIQYGIALTKPQRQFRNGERVPLVAFFRNASDKPLKIDTRPDYFGNTPNVTDAKGAAVALENVPLVGHIAHYVETLAPGEAVGPFYFNFGLGENPRPGKQHWHPYDKAPTPGTYTLTHSVPFKVGGPNNGDPSKPGEITSGQIDFEIVDTAKSEN
ncbi:MAG: blaR1 8 [Schlesneria sp.]|nr:blaR1 8 [Schlesneria sp.]